MRQTRRWEKRRSEQGASLRPSCSAGERVYSDRLRRVCNTQAPSLQSIDGQARGEPTQAHEHALLPMPVTQARIGVLQYRRASMEIARDVHPVILGHWHDTVWAEDVHEVGAVLAQRER